MSAEGKDPVAPGDDRLEQAETRIAFQERALQELSDAVYRQELVIERLESVVKLLSERIAELAATVPGAGPDDERPPHY